MTDKAKTKLNSSLTVLFRFMMATGTAIAIWLLTHLGDYAITIVNNQRDNRELVISLKRDIQYLHEAIDNDNRGIEKELALRDKSLNSISEDIVILKRQQQFNVDALAVINKTLNLHERMLMKIGP